jgi:hypothetical protein
MDFAFWKLLKMIKAREERLAQLQQVAALEVISVSGDQGVSLYCSGLHAPSASDCAHAAEARSPNPKDA